MQKLAKLHAADQAEIARLQAQIAEQRKQAQEQQAAVEQLQAQVSMVQVALVRGRSAHGNQRLAAVAARGASGSH